MALKSENFNNIMANPKQRNIYIATAAIGVLAIVVGAIYATSPSSGGQPKAEVSVAAAPQIQSVPGTSTSPHYNDMVKESNKVEAENALKQDKTFVAPPVNDNLNTESPLDLLDKQRKAQKEAEEKAAMEEKAQEPEKKPEPVVEAPPAPPPPAPQPQVAKQTKKWGSDEDYMLLATLSNSWKAKDAAPEFNYAGQKMPNNQTAQGASGQGSQGGSSPSLNKGALLGKAGTVYHAVLETGINSDEPSPVLAKIVSGDLKGSRLIGNMVTSGKKVVVEFNTLSMPSMGNSIKIKAVAVDPANARTGLASDVDNHYFLKYGVLLASTFLGGYADAVAQQNTTTQATNGVVVTTRSNFSNSQLATQGLGSVGKELANETRQQVQGLKPTITVNSGIAIGVLLMDDLYSGQ